MARQRIFVAGYPPADVVESLRSIPRVDEPGVRWMPAEEWHVTVRFVGDAAPDEVAERLAAASLPSARVELGPAVSMLGDAVVVVPCAGVDRLAAAVVAATSGLGDPPELRPYRGHLTLARLRPDAVCSSVGSPVSARFDLREVAVVASTLQPTGARYEILERIPTAEEVR